MRVARSGSAAFVAAVVAFFVLMGLGISPASADGTGGSISGHVTDSLGNPVAGVQVSGSGIGVVGFPTTTTDAAGDYTLTGLGAGSYTVVFIAPSDTDLVMQYYPAAASWAESVAVPVGQDAVVTGIDAQLAQGGSVSGTVLNADGSPGAGATIFVIPPGVITDVGVGRALVDGTYVVHGVPAGSYQIKVEESDLETGVPTIWYPSSASRDGASTITVSPSVVTSGIDVVRTGEVVPTPTGTIAGTVIGADGLPAAGALVSALSAFPEPATTTTGPDGSYALTVAAGPYLVSATIGGSTVFHPASPTASGATSVSVVGGRSAEGVDISFVPVVVPSTGSISGRATGPDGTPVAFASVFASATPFGPGGFTSTAADGTYTLTGLAAGSYRVQVQAPWGSPLVTQYYPSGGYTDATPVAVVVGTPTTGIDVVLPLGGSISGAVTLPAGFEGTQVTFIAHDAGGGFAAYYGQYSSWTGGYTISGIPAGTYTVEASPTWGSALLHGYYPGSVAAEDATVLTVAAGGSVTGIDFALAVGGTITGVVTGPDGPVAGANILGEPVGSVATSTALYATTDATGRYTVTGVRPGSYTLDVSAPWSSTLVSTYYPGPVLDVAHAGAVTVTGGSTTVADQTLIRSASITGRVLDDAGHPNPDGGWLTVVDQAGKEVGGGDIDAEGNYSITRNLPAGTYTVHAGPYNSSLLPAYHPASATLGGATFFTVAEGGSVTGIDVTLTSGGTLHVTLTDPQGRPAQRVLVQALSDGTLAGSTDADGTAEIKGLALGTTRVAFGRASGDTPYVAQYFRAPHGTTVTESNGSRVALAAGSTTTIAAKLRTGAHITGVVRGADGSPKPGQMVVAFVEDFSPGTSAGSPAGSPLATRSAITKADGSYTIQGLLPGRYLVSAAYSAPGSADTFYGTGTTHGAPNVKVVGTATTKHIDITIGTTFADVQPTSPFAADIEWIAAQGFLPGVTAPGGTVTFGSSATVTRGDLAGVLYRAAGSPALKKASTFTDVPTTDPNYAAIGWAASKGYLTGSTVHGKAVFRPGAVAARSAAAGALYRFAGSPFFTTPRHRAYADVGGCTPEIRAITWLGTLGVSSGGTNAFGAAVFHPQGALRRGALAEALHAAVVAKH